MLGLLMVEHNSGCSGYIQHINWFRLGWIDLRKIELSVASLIVYVVTQDNEAYISSFPKPDTTMADQGQPLSLNI